MRRRAQLNKYFFEILDRRNSRRGAPADKQQAQMARNNADGAPLRHGLSWSAGEDERLRAAFQAGEAIAAIAAAHERKTGAVTARLYGSVS